MQLKAAQPSTIEKTYLFEPGLLNGGSEQESLSRREILLQAAQKLRVDEELEFGLQIFLDAVSPRRSRKPRPRKRKSPPSSSWSATSKRA